MPLRILFIAPPVAPIGDGIGGGVETSLRQLTRELTRRGHRVGTVAVEGSRGLDGQVFEIGGRCPASVTRVGRGHVATVEAGGVLERMWEAVRGLQSDYDLVLNTGYDWLSYYLASFLRVPVLHWVSVCPLVDSVDRMIEIRYRQQPSRFAFYSRTQAAAFSFVHAPSAQVLYGGVDADIFKFVAEPEPRLCWSARISPEKGLEDALDACRQSGARLDVCGRIEDQGYWRRLQPKIDAAGARYRGFLSPVELAAVLGQSSALLVTPKWEEAFGVSLIEAMACGTPVVAYAGGGPSEIIEQGVNGFLVERSDIRALAEHALLASRLDRQKVRATAERFSVAALADRVERWIATI